MAVSEHLRCVTPIRVYWPALADFVDARCRRCEGCRKLRQWAWTARAAHEQAFAKSTWFITLTFGPRRRSAIFAAATADERDLTPTKRLVSAAGAYVTTYTKTLRKRGFQFRHLCVPELHRDGFPHFHGLVHDQRGDLHLEALRACWNAGWEVTVPVRDANALRYVTKYLCKDNIGRIRASQQYGDPTGRLRRNDDAWLADLAPLSVGEPQQCVAPERASGLG